MMNFIFSRTFFDTKFLRRISSNLAIAFCAFFLSSNSFAQLFPVAGTCTSTLASNYYGAPNSASNPLATGRGAIIYNASQLSGLAGKNLSSIYFKKMTSTDMVGTPNIKIYLKETTSTDFGTGALDWGTAVAGAALVYDGNPAAYFAGGAGMKQIVFNNNFVYSGGSNNLMLLTEYVNTGNNVNVTWGFEYLSPCVDVTNSNTTKYNTNLTGVLGQSLTLSDSRRPLIAFDYVVACPAPSLVALTNISSNNATASWNPGGTETSWEYAVVPAGSPAPTTFTTTSTTSVTLNLNPITSYDFYVKANCGGNGSSALRGPFTFKTLCGALTSMYENFDSYGTGYIVPECWARLVGTYNYNQSISNVTPTASGQRQIYQQATSPATGTIVIMPSFSNINAGTHWLRFRARTDVATGGSLDVGYITDVTNASTFVNIQTVAISTTNYNTQESEYTVIVPNTVPANARLAIRNYGTKTASHYWDDVYWELAPTCFPPTNLAVTSQTDQSVSLSWAAASPVPANGYEFYYSTSSTAPTAATIPQVTGVMGTSTTISGLTPFTSYNIWIRSACSSADISTWSWSPVYFATNCQSPAVSSVVGANICTGASATLQANPSPATATIRWYDSATGGSLLATGNYYATPPLTTTKNYWAAAYSGIEGYVGKNQRVSSAGVNTFNDVGLMFNAEKQMVIKSVDVYTIHASNAVGDITIALKDASGNIINNKTVTVNTAPSPGVLNTIELDFPVSAGNDYRLVWIGTNGVTSMVRESTTTGIAFPYTINGLCSITKSYAGFPTLSYYNFFYNWKVEAGCESPRQQVTATVGACLATSEVDLKDNFKIHPNPVNDILYIDNSDKVKSLNIVDVSGRVVYSEAAISGKIDLSNLKGGMYLLNLELKDGSKVSHKIIKK